MPRSCSPEPSDRCLGSYPPTPGKLRAKPAWLLSLEYEIRKLSKACAPRRNLFRRHPRNSLVECDSRRTSSDRPPPGARLHASVRPNRPPSLKSGSRLPFQKGVVVDATEMGSITELPNACAIIGGGVIAVEYANVLAGLGIGVSLLCKEEVTTAHLSIAPSQHASPVGPSKPKPSPIELSEWAPCRRFVIEGLW